MRIQASAALLSIVVVMGVVHVGTSAQAAADQRTATPIQYDRYPDQRPYYPPPNDRYYPNERRDGYYPYPSPRGAYDGPKWRPGQMLPAEFLNYVVNDWEERGLGRPPGGHQWVRVGFQFILVRERDRMIARTVNFD